MSPQVFTATLFLLHLYLEPVSEVPALAQTVYKSVFAIEDVLAALLLLVQTVKVESPDCIHIIPADPIEKSVFSQRLVQLWSDIELGGNSLFMRLKNGIVLGVRGVQLLEFWLNNQTPEFTAIPVMHGCMRIAGYRFGGNAYITDASNVLLDENRKALEGIHTLVIGALRDKPHWSHFTFDQAVEAAKAIGAEEVWFTHINHATAHAEIERRYAPYARPAYDTLVLEVDDER